MITACRSFARNCAEQANSVSIATLQVVGILLPSAHGGSGTPARSRELKIVDKPSTPTRLGKIPLDHPGVIPSSIDHPQRSAVLRGTIARC